MVIILLTEQPNKSLRQVITKTYKTWSGLESFARPFGAPAWTLEADHGSVRKYITDKGATVFAVDIESSAIDMIAKTCNSGVQGENNDT